MYILLRGHKAQAMDNWQIFIRGKTLSTSGFDTDPFGSAKGI